MDSGKAHRRELFSRVPAALIIALLAFICLLASSFSCRENIAVQTNNPQFKPTEIDSLDAVVPPPRKDPMEITPASTGEEIYYSRCSTCHIPEKKIDKYRGEQWEAVIGRMIRKEGALFTPQLAEKVYEYLYNRTKRPEDPPFEEVVAGRSHFEAPVVTTGEGG
jgi:mono/diheme cytochrome c family protein